MTKKSVHTQREELVASLPGFIQPVVTWLSGIPGSKEMQRIRLTPMGVIGLGCGSIGVGFGLIYLALTLHWLPAISLYVAGLCFVAGGARRLDVLIIHQSLHAKVFGSQMADQALGEFLTVVLLRTPYIENRREHLRHHRFPCDENDVDVAFLRSAGVALAKDARSLYWQILKICLSPIFHLRFLGSRLKANFITATPVSRLVMAWAYGFGLLVPTIWLGASYLNDLLLFWLIPLTFGFQVSNFLYTATKHRWWLFSNHTVRNAQKRDLLSYARVCCSPAPSQASIPAWTKWWLTAIFIHLPTRLFVVVGDSVLHDLHHVAPNCDWPNSIRERTKYRLMTPHRFSEVWGGMPAHLRECNLASEAERVLSNLLPKNHSADSARRASLVPTKSNIENRQLEAG